MNRLHWSPPVREEVCVNLPIWEDTRWDCSHQGGHMLFAILTLGVESKLMDWRLEQIGP